MYIPLFFVRAYILFAITPPPPLIYQWYNRQVLNEIWWFFLISDFSQKETYIDLIKFFHSIAIFSHHIDNI